MKYSFAFLLALFYLIEPATAQVKITCKTDGARILDENDKEIPTSWDLYQGEFRVARAEKPGYRSRAVIVGRKAGIMRYKVEIPTLEKYPDVSHLKQSFLPGPIDMNLNKGKIEIAFFMNAAADKRQPAKPMSKLVSTDKLVEKNFGGQSVTTQLINRMDLKRKGGSSVFSDFSTTSRLSFEFSYLRLKEYYEGKCSALEAHGIVRVTDVYGATVFENTYKVTGNTIPFFHSQDANTSTKSADLIAMIPRAFFVDVMERMIMDVLKDSGLEDALKAHHLSANGSANFGVIQLSAPAARSGSEDIRSSFVTVRLLQSHGSGCIVSTDGHIVTNYHVVGKNPGDSLQVILHNGEKHRAQVLRADPISDLALLKINTNDLKALRPERSHKPVIGDRVMTIGTPSDPAFGQTVTAGVLSAVREANGSRFLQIDANVSPGNSGGGLITADGKLIGIVSQKMIGSMVEGLGFAIPASVIYERLNITY